MMQPPEQIISRSGIRKGMTVLEVGCGSGAYTLDVAIAVGEDGEVHAIDMQKDMLNQLRKKLEKAENKNIGNIQITEVNARDLPYGKDSFDLVYMITVLQEIPKRQRALEEIYRVLKPGGIIAVSEFLTDPDYPLRSTTKKQLESVGFKVEEVAGSFFSYTARGRKISKS
jgi:ubiquinone/menaquinone biosynthesis C-methylase UbiE